MHLASGVKLSKSTAKVSSTLLSVEPGSLHQPGKAGSEFVRRVRQPDADYQPTLMHRQSPRPMHRNSGVALSDAGVHARQKEESLNGEAGP